jgi:hypothetical protein
MATPAQIIANRANAQKSTGPRSAEGKSASRFNALKHGIDAQSAVIPGEDPAAYDALAADYHREYRPESPSESFHVETMLRADWQKRRLVPVEADLTRTLLAESPGASLAAALLSESPAARLLARVQRQIAGFERAWHRADAAFRRTRRLDGSADDKAFDKYLDILCAKELPAELASFPQDTGWHKWVPPGQPCASEQSSDTKSWPPVDEKTGRPLYFVG